MMDELANDKMPFSALAIANRSRFKIYIYVLERLIRSSKFQKFTPLPRYCNTDPLTFYFYIQ